MATEPTKGSFHLLDSVASRTDGDVEARVAALKSRADLVALGRRTSCSSFFSTQRKKSRFATRREQGSS